MQAAQSRVGPLSVVTAFQSQINSLGERDGELAEVIAISLALAQPFIHTGQTFAINVGWGNFDGDNAVGATAAGIVSRGAFGPSSTVTLVRASLLTLNDAVHSGNFTVLRDRAAPGFRDANTAARLSQIFASLMRDGTDMSAVAVASPQLGEAPSIDAQSGMLQIKGHFELASGRLDFALAFQHVRRRWLLFGIYAQPAAPAFAAPAGAAQLLLKGGEPSPDPPPAKGEQ